LSSFFETQQILSSDPQSATGTAFDMSGLPGGKAKSGFGGV
jgi:hypothetical protein